MAKSHGRYYATPANDIGRTPHEVAQRLGTSAQWVIRHATRLPFYLAAETPVYDPDNPRHVWTERVPLFSDAGLEEFMTRGGLAAWRKRRAARSR